MIYYAASDSGFYFSKIHGKNIPSDSIEITQEEYDDIFRSIKNNGCTLCTGEDGKPFAKPIAEESIESMLSRAKEKIRAVRSPILDALSGIAGRASRSGNNDLAFDADSVALQLLDITDDADLNSAQTYDAMMSSAYAAFRRISDGVNSEVSVAFRGANLY